MNNNCLIFNKMHLSIKCHFINVDRKSCDKNYHTLGVGQDKF